VDYSVVQNDDKDMKRRDTVKVRVYKVKQPELPVFEILRAYGGRLAFSVDFPGLVVEVRDVVHEIPHFR
jgi:hypothetical protein